MVRWNVQSRGVTGGPYEDHEVRDLVTKGLRDALVRPENGDWVHISKSPFAALVAKDPDQNHYGWKALAYGATAIVAYLVLKVLWASLTAR